MKQTTQISFTIIPTSSPDLNAPGRGVEQWHNANEVNVPTDGINTQRLDVYYRFGWYQVEGATQGSYNWSYFDSLINSAIQKGQKLSFGIMTLNPDGGGVSYNGGSSYYPQYLHNLMQAETTKDWLQNGVWVPNYNSPSYLTRLAELYKAINSHLETTFFNGVRYKDVINFIDIRGYGSWGEWHHGSLVNDVQKEFPANALPTIASLKKIIDAHTQNLADYRLVAMIAGFDGGSTFIPLFYSPPEVAYYLLTAKTNAGDVGWRRDQWGATDTYLSGLLENNTASFNGVQLKTLIMNKWKTAPITGEPPSWNDNNFAALPAQVKLYHATSFGNGNYGADVNVTLASNVREASKACGYRIIIEKGLFEYDDVLRKVTVTLDWRNVGLTPTYENWIVEYKIKNATIGKEIGAIQSSISLKSLLPGAAQPFTDSFKIPDNIPPGNYTFDLVIRQTLANRILPLAVNGKATDGSYRLSTFIVKDIATPVKWGYFKYDESSDSLLWATESEQNNDYFSVEESEDGNTWKEIAKVPSKANEGNSEIKIEYSYKL